LESIEKDVIEKAARSSLYFPDYVKFVHNWEPRPHQRVWVEALQQLADGTLLDVSGKPTRKLMILAFPGSGKTDTMCEYNAWMIGRSCLNNEIPQVGYVSYSDDVAMIRSVAVRDTIEYNENYRLTFPYALPHKDKRWAGHEWFLYRSDWGKKDPTFRSAGITGGILSYRFPTLITIDDPHDPKNMKTIHQRDEVWRIWQTTIRTRAYEATPIVLICTRWSEDDLAGRLMSVEKDWHVIHTPALNEFEESCWPPEKSGMGFSTKMLNDLRRIDKESFLTQYMALPPSSVGDIFKWWTFGPRPVRDQVDRVYQCWDTAYTKKSWSSYSAMVEMVKLKNGRVFVSDVFRDKMEFPALLDAVMLKHHESENLWGMDVMVLVENKASGAPVVDMFSKGLPGRIRKVDLPRHIERGSQQKDLVGRAAAISKYFETGHIILPDTFEPWKDEYLSEMKAFPRGQYDDQVSATLLGLEYVYPARTLNADYRLEVAYEGWGRA